MILDSLKNAALYESVSPRIKQALEKMAITDWSEWKPGKYEIDGKDLFVNIVERGLKTKEEAKLEVHDEYIDIQMLLSGAKESFGWSERCNLTQPQSEFNKEKDIQFFDDAPQTYYTLCPGQFTILFPEDAHAPLVGEGEIRKLIFKVKI